MLYSKIPGIDMPVSRLVQGTMWMKSSDLDAAFAAMDSFLAAGGNCFDTAHLYGLGDNERTVGQWIHSRGVRDEIVILGKGAHNSQDRKRVTPFDIQSDIHDSLARFKVDHIDLYLLHKDDPAQPVGPVVETLHAAREAGQIGAYGGSNWKVERAARGQRVRGRARSDAFCGQQPAVQPGGAAGLTLDRLREPQRAGGGAGAGLVPAELRHAFRLVQPGGRLLQRPFSP